jgi:hypothetical protein
MSGARQLELLKEHSIAPNEHSASWVGVAPWLLTFVY